MNIQSIITLLQLVLVLLSNPVTANNPQTQALASQAVSLAQQALRQASIDTVPSIPSIMPSPNLGASIPSIPAPTISAPVVPSPVVATIPSCTLSGIAPASDGQIKKSVTITWATQGITSDTLGELDAINSGRHITVNNSMGLQGVQTDLQMAQSFVASFGNTTCYATFSDYDPYSPNSVTSTPNAP